MIMLRIFLLLTVIVVFVTPPILIISEFFRNTRFYKVFEWWLKDVCDFFGFCWGFIGLVLCMYLFFIIFIL